MDGVTIPTMKTDLNIEMPDGRLKKFGHRFVNLIQTVNIIVCVGGDTCIVDEE